MRKTILYLVMLAASFGLIGLMPTRAEAHWRHHAGRYYPTYRYHARYYGPVQPGYYYPPAAYYPAYYPTYTNAYYVSPGYTTYYAPARVVVPPRPWVSGYVTFPGGSVAW